MSRAGFRSSPEVHEKTVCVIAQGRAFGGTEAHTLGLISALQDRGYHIEFVLARSPGYASALADLQSPSVDVYAVDLGGVMDSDTDPFRWLSVLRDLRSSILVLPKGHNLACSLTFLAVCALKFRRRYAIEHLEADPAPPHRRLLGFLPFPSAWRISEMFARRARGIMVHHIVTVSHAVRARLVDDWGYSPEKLTTVSNGVPISRFGADAAVREAARATYSLPRAARIFACVGRLVAVKGLDVAFRAFATMSKRVPGADWRLIVVGEGPEREALQSLAVELGISDRVLFLGFMRDPRPAYFASDLIVFASRTEGLPIALLEGMAAGLVPVVTQVGGMPEAVDGPEIGWTAVANDELSLAAALESALRSTKAQLSSMSRAAQEKVRLHYDARHSYAKVLDAFNL